MLEAAGFGEEQNFFLRLGGVQCKHAPTHGKEDEDRGKEFFHGSRLVKSPRRHKTKPRHVDVTGGTLRALGEADALGMVKEILWIVLALDGGEEAKVAVVGLLRIFEAQVRVVAVVSLDATSG